MYTDTIYFAPLTSSFADPLAHIDSTFRPFIRSQSAPPHPRPAGAESRHEWIELWRKDRGHSLLSPLEGPIPVSAKSVYRLADKLNLEPLKILAFQHINGQLTPANIPFEVFSRFSATYDEVGKVQVAFFLKHWSEIKKSDTMTQIWRQIRVGKHVGFEEGESARAGTVRAFRAFTNSSLAFDRQTARVQAVVRRDRD